MSDESEQWDLETIHRLARGISIEQELDQLRADNARLKGEVEAWRKEVEGSASGATFVTIKNLNLEISSWKRCAKENAILADNRLADLQRHKSCLEVARGALMAADQFMRGCDEKHFVELREQALHQINEVLGDSTKTT